MVCGIPVGSEGTRIIEVLVGFGGVGVRSAVERPGGLLRIGVRCTTLRPLCGCCGGSLCSDGDRLVEVVDLPSLGRVCAVGVAQA